jgi:addiction module RelE/StbE family toxin
VKIVWTEPARLDLREIFSYIAEENPNAARRLLANIKEKAVLLQDNPQIGRAGRVDGTRELVITGTEYSLPYRIKGLQIQILAVFHGARRWPDRFNSEP